MYDPELEYVMCKHKNENWFRYFLQKKKKKRKRKKNPPKMWAMITVRTHLLLTVLFLAETGRASCPLGFVQHGTSCYMTFHIRASWSEANVGENYLKQSWILVDKILLNYSHLNKYF